MPDARLPCEDGLNIPAFSRLFDNVTNSYKFLWTLGLLEIVGRDEFADGRIPIRRIVAEMLAAAEHPLRQFRLSFGAFDKMMMHVVALEKAAREISEPLLEGISEKNPKEKVFASACWHLARFVPQQWLAPFFEGELTRAQRSDARAKEIRRLAAIHFSGDNPPPYRFAVARRAADIELHPRWRAYLIRHYEIVRGWTMYHWIDFLQARNPTVPAIVNKIARPESRQNLIKEREWWRAVLEKIGGVKCLYSGARIAARDDFALDHYVPWSFVGHNRLWNLIPVTKEANSSKGDNLPSEAKYFAKFTDLQHRGLATHARHFLHAGRGWRDITDAYADDLKIPLSPPSTRIRLGAAYELVIPPLIALAKNRGFAENWDYDALRAETLKNVPLSRIL